MTLLLRRHRYDSCYRDVSEEYVKNRINLCDSEEPTQVSGKVHICPCARPPRNDYYGLVVELRGTIIFKGQKDIHIFGVPKNSIPKSTVYHQIYGSIDDPKPIPFSAYTRKTFDFCLKLPTDRPLPPSMTLSHVTVKYEILVYRRTEEEGYIFYGEGFRKILNFYGYNPRHLQPPRTEILQKNRICQPFSGPGLEGCLHLLGSDYGRNEEIPFTVQMFRVGGNCINIRGISVTLLRTVIASFNIEEEVVESCDLDVDAMNKVRNNEGACSLRGVFKDKRELPSYNNDANGNEDGGLRIVYTIKCEISTDEDTIGGQVEVVIRTWTRNEHPPTIRMDSLEKDLKISA